MHQITKNMSTEKSWFLESLAPRLENDNKEKIFFERDKKKKIHTIIFFIMSQ